jgi:hypothetical protein
VGWTSTAWGDGGKAKGEQNGFASFASCTSLPVWCCSLSPIQ